MPESSAQSFDPHLAGQLQAVIDEAQISLRLKGISAAAIVPEQGLWEGASGLSGPSASDSMKSHTRFPIASIKKTFVAATILKLTEEGVLNLDDSLHQSLPPMQYVNLDITLRQLLSHSSGIYNYTDHPSFWNTLWTEISREWTPEEVVSNFGSTPVFSPGSRFEYSNTNFLLLSMVIRNETDDSMSSNYRDRFWSPLQFSNTFLGGEEATAGEIAHLWSDLNGDGQLDDIHHRIGTSMHTLLWPFVYSTAGELAQWASALYGGQILESATLDEMFDVIPINPNPYWTGYGLGTMRYIFDGDELWGHGGRLPGLRSIMVYSPVTGISISVLVNQDHFDSVYRVAASLYETIKGVLPVDISSEGYREVPTHVTLYPVSPNPFNHTAVIAFDLPRRQYVTVEIFDVRGKKQATLVEAYFEPGNHRVTWQAEDRTSGVYLCRVQVGDMSTIRSAVLIK